MDHVLVGDIKMGYGMTKSEDFFFDSRFRTHVVATTVCATGGVHTLRVARAFFRNIFLAWCTDIPYTHGSMCLECACHSSLHITLSIPMFHPFSLLFPDGHFETTFPALTSAPSLPNCSRSESAGQAHFRTSGGEFGCLADPTYSTGCEPKEFDKIASADGDKTPINDPNYNNISNFSKITRENTGLFGVFTMLEPSVSHVSHGESKDSMHRETVVSKTEKAKASEAKTRFSCIIEVHESTRQRIESVTKRIHEGNIAVQRAAFCLALQFSA